MSTKVKWWVSLLVLAGISALGVWVVQNEHRSEAPPSASMGSKAGVRPAPQFVLNDAKGGVVRLEQLQGKPVILHFWAAWCPPCLAEIMAFAEASAALQDLDAHWVAISLDPSWKEADRALDSKHAPASLRMLLDAEQKVSDQYGSYQFPETYILNRKGEIVQKWIGPQAWSDASWRVQFKDMLRAL